MDTATIPSPSRRAWLRPARVWMALGAALIAIVAVVDVTTIDPRVHVRWRAEVGPADRVALERRYGLGNGEQIEEGTSWRYQLRDRSRNNIRALVLDPAVGDTGYIDREAFTAEIQVVRVTVQWEFLYINVWLLLGGGALLWAARATSEHRRRNAVLWSVLIILSSSFALAIYELPHVDPSVQTESWWIFMTPETWDFGQIKELGLWENVTAVSFFVSGIILVATSIVRPFGARNSMWIPLLFGVVYLWVTAEEISFGQQFLDFTTPESVKLLNTQGETNFHNIVSDNINYYAVFLVFYGYIGVFPIVTIYNQTARKLTLRLNIPEPPIAFAIIIIPVFIVYSADLVLGRRIVSLFGLREIRELMFALAILGTTIDWFVKNRVTPR